MGKLKTENMSNQGCINLLNALFPEKKLKARVLKELKGNSKEVA